MVEAQTVLASKISNSSQLLYVNIINNFMQLSKPEIQHIAKLARLELTDEELKKYGGQLSNVLSYIDQLKEVEVKGVLPTAQVTGLENVLRPDEAENWDEKEIEAALADAPEREGRFIKVKRVIE